MKNVFAPSERLKQIPIFYIPIHPKDKQKRTGLAWSILYGYNRAHNISRLFSRWSTPSKYYVSFPHGVYKPSQLQKKRGFISSPNSICLSSPDGKTIKDDELLAFTFDSAEYSLMKAAYKEEEKYLWKNGVWKDGRFVGEKFSMEDRFTGRFIRPQQLVKNLEFSIENTFSVNAYNNISSWNSYCEFLASPARNMIGQRPNSILKYKEYNPIGEDISEEL
jgi:hypothetical protein